MLCISDSDTNHSASCDLRTHERTRFLYLHGLCVLCDVLRVCCVCAVCVLRACCFSLRAVSVAVRMHVCVICVRLYACGTL